jgi:tRNA(adenine34) deaminase
MINTLTYPLFSDEYFMNEALKEARKAGEKDEVPVGAVIVCQNRIIARAYNLTETLNDVTAHAEMQAFTAAADHLGGKYLDECILYVTVEPCVMCAGAAFWTQLGRLVYGAVDEKRGFTTIGKNILHPATETTSGMLAAECARLMTDFFRKKRIQ